MDGRFAVYWVPARRDPLWRFGCAWLGCDSETGEDLAPADTAGLSLPEWAAVTERPRRYGFHATVVAPFRLAEGCTLADLDAALDAFAAARRPFPRPGLRVRSLGAFLALRPDDRDPARAAVHALADDAVRAFAPFRDPAADATRPAEGLGARKRALLARWGYPFVFEAYRFHLTLTGPLDPDLRAALMPRLAARADPPGGAPADIDEVSLFHEPGPGRPFRLRRRVRLGAPSPG